MSSLSELFEANSGCLDVRIWDVGHGLSVRLKTPNGQNHIIDAGANNGFSPAEHIAENYWDIDDILNYLIISHPDQDHIQDLPNIVRFIGKPKTLLRNKTVPDQEKFGSENLEYQKIYKSLDISY